MSVQLLVSIVVLGAVYSLIGTGFVVMFRTTGILSFAQGSFLLLGTLEYVTLSDAGWPFPLAVIVASAGTGVCAALCYVVLFDRPRHDALFSALATAGLSVALGAVALVIWTPNLRPSTAALSAKAHQILPGLSMSPNQVYAIALSVAVSTAVVVFVNYTKLGLRMRAVSERRDLAVYAGIRVTGMSALAWGMSGVVAAAAGIAYSLGNSVDPSTFSDVGLALFPAILVGGMDSLTGVAVGSLILAALQSLVSYDFNTEWENVIPYMLLLAVLWVRPSGLFGRRSINRV